MDNTSEITDEQRVEELASTLYEDLKTKYILLKQRNIDLEFHMDRLGHKVKNITSSISRLRYGRKKHNSAINLAYKKVEEYCRTNNINLEDAADICKLILETKMPPLDIDLTIKIKEEKDDEYTTE